MSQEPWPPEASELEEPPANGGGGKSRPVLALLKIAALLSIVALCALSLRQDNGARRLPPKLGERYLEALRTNDYATAYGMLSRASRAAYSLDAFRKSLDASPWSWSGLALASSRPGLAALEYDFLAPGRPARRDTLIFALEQGRWVHPCDWPILRQARDAFARRNPALALLKAEEAARVDPFDPAARGLLCRSACLAGTLKLARFSCARALELARRYPSRLSAPAPGELSALLAAAQGVKDGGR